MIHPELRYLGSIDALTVTLDDYSPTDPENVSITVDAYIGPAGGPGEDIFQFVVCTPGSLAAKVNRKGWVFAWNYLVVPRYDYQLVRQALSNLCAQVEGPDWKTVAARLSRYGQWEFEGYEAEPATTEIQK